MASSWLILAKKIGWGLFIAAVLWFMIALATAEWSGLFGYNRYLGM